MKCHYDVLEIAKDADSETIKKAYRKLALKWHPDKNLSNIEEATLEFRSVQQAYDVLSDPQERAWYDKHREAILRGGLGHGDEYEDQSVDIYAYFNSSCYKGYGDDEQGFYTVYSEVFQKIAEEDYEFMEDRGSESPLPRFGRSDSVFEEVVQTFYGYWESYSTAKTFVWMEKWDTREAPDRATRRAMEAENRKMCELKRKERNEEVRALVAFVKKRDKRVQAWKQKLEERAAEVQRLAKEKQLCHKKEQMVRMQNFQETEWSAASNLEDHLQQLENQLSQQFNDVDDSSDDEEESNLMCVVCNKAFRTERAFANHEKSKKHKENLQALKEELLAEDAELFDEEDDNTPDSNTPSKLSKKQKKKRRQAQKENKTPDNVEQEELDNSMAAVSLDGGEMTKENVPMESTVNDVQKGSALETEPKVKEKRKKKALSTQQPKQEAVEEETDPVQDLSCKVCKETFPSRNRLFEHIELTRHATIKTADGKVTDDWVGNTKSKKKGKKR